MSRSSRHDGGEARDSAQHSVQDSAQPGLSGDAVPGLAPQRSSGVPIKRVLAFGLFLASFVAVGGWIAYQALTRHSEGPAAVAPDVASASADKPRLADPRGNTVPVLTAASAASATAATSAAPATTALRVPAIEPASQAAPLRVIPNGSATPGTRPPGPTGGPSTAGLPSPIDAPVLAGAGAPRMVRTGAGGPETQEDDDPAADAMRRNLQALSARKAELEQLQKRAMEAGTRGTEPAGFSPAGFPAPGAGLPGRTADEQPASGAGRLLGTLEQSATPRVRAGLLAQRALTIPKGTLFTCALKTRVVTATSGLVGCQVQRNVYGHDGKVLLVERGSHLDGEYRIVQVRPGLTRIPVMWTRILTPAGVTVDLESPATGALGESGLGGYVDNRWPERIGAALLLSLVDDALKYALASQSDAGNSSSVYLSGTANQGSKLAEKVLDTTINIPPLLYANQGGVVGVYVARDLDFSGVYSLQPAAVAAELSGTGPAARTTP